MKRDNYIDLVDPAIVSNLAKEFENVTPTEFREPGFIADFLKRGDVKSAIVTIEKQPAYLFAFHLTNDGGFWIDLLKAISGGSFAIMAGMIEDLARNYSARYIRFTTARAGLVELARELGYTCEAVMLCKGI